MDIPKTYINFLGEGIENCRNGCFFNSINQMLFHMVEFREFMIINIDLFTKNEILYSLAGLFTKMKDSEVITRYTKINNSTLDKFYIKIKLVVDYLKNKIISLL